MSILIPQLFVFTSRWIRSALFLINTISTWNTWIISCQLILKDKIDVFIHVLPITQWNTDCAGIKSSQVNYHNSRLVCRHFQTPSFESPFPGRWPAPEIRTQQLESDLYLWIRIQNINIIDQSCKLRPCVIAWTSSTMQSVNIFNQ